MGRRQDMGRGPGTGSPRDGWPQPARPRGRWAGLAVGLGAIVLVVVLLVVALLRLTSWHPSLTNPFGTRTVDRSQPVLLLSLQNLSDYKAATANLQLVIDLEKDARFIPSFIKGERTLFVAAGSVDRLSSVVSDDPNGQRELYRLAEQRIQAATLQSDLLPRAEQNTRAMLESMLRSLR